MGRCPPNAASCDQEQAIKPDLGAKRSRDWGPVGLSEITVETIQTESWCQIVASRRLGPSSRLKTTDLTP
jgi:hypothetical protein